ncbi:hypothetical protein, variant 1 [Aphanomyces astaci]|uniref:PWWP domain-containing protein n=1 Tax=Aphanomyces astaci TaxID=112090 RepID=W4H6C8_APHAT|nr:hypothetical protein, variant 1 [Aphanomyces astaci]ETV86854.1 hypothetical protein, variant 1 [Aphanomyces astaci]|eukprot:XP_009823654.1 hypothetical protein, variant 1 [Aphanomyces astaci]
MVLPPYNTVAWGLLKGYPWWPVYVFDPKKLRPDLYHLGSAHAQILKRAQEEPQKWRIVYYFASYDFGLHSTTMLKSWNGKDHNTLKAGYPETSCIEGKVVELFMNALREVEDYLSTAATQRTLPYIIPSDLDPKLSPPRPDIIDLVDSDDEGVQPAGHPSSLASPAPPRPMRDDTVSNVPYNSLAWVRPQGFPWWPVYVCDPTELRDDLHHLGRNHVTLLMRARNEPNDHRLVYYFGRYVFGLLKTKLKPWKCAEHDMYAIGSPSDMFDKRVELIEEFTTALAEANACFQPGRPMMPPTIPYLEPSDLHKSLPAPPPLVVPFLSLGWTSKDGYTWLPVYVLDPYTVNPVLHHLGNKHAKGLHEVLSNPDNLRLVYIFGCHEIESRPNDAVKPWQGPEHAAFVKGFPKAVKKPIALDMLTQALNEAKNFDSTNKASRRLPFMNKEDIQYRGNPRPPVATSSIKSKAATRRAGIQDSAEQRGKRAESLFWIKPANQAWWPVYVCDARTFPSNLHLLGKSHAHHLANTKAKMKQHRLVYYLGRHVFWMHKATELTAWDCPHQVDYLSAPPIPGNSDEECSEFTNAISEALRFLESGELPYLTRHDLDPSLPSPEKAVIPYNSLAWVLRDGYPWMPVYVCDPAILKPTLTNLGNAHAQYLETATQRATNFRLVYYFGKHEFGLHRAKGVFRTWLGPDHDYLVKGLPRSIFINKHGRQWRSRNDFMFNIFDAAMLEVKEFINQPESHRMLPQLVASDFTTSRVPLTILPTRRSNNNDDDVDAPARQSHSDDDSYSNESASDQGVDVDSDDQQDVANHGSMYGVMAWSQRSPTLWMPAYVCDPFKLRSTLELLGTGHVETLRRVRESPHDSRIVYFFGDHCFGARRAWDMVKPWNCAEHDEFMRIVLNVKPVAWEEVETYLSEEASTRLPPGFTPSDMRLVARDPQASSDDEGATSAAAHTTAVAPKAARSLDVDTRSSRSPKRRKSTRNHLPASPPPVTTKPRTVPSQSRPPPPAKKRARSPSPTENNSNQPTRASFDPKDSAVAIGPGFTQPMRHGGVMQTSNSYVRHTPPSKRPTEPYRPAPVAPAVKEVRITETAIKDIPLDSMAWARRSDTLSASSPWWPVYVCDPERLQPTLEHLGNRHQKLLVTAKQYPNSLRLVYLFGGTPSFDVCAKNMARWRGPDHDLLLKGHPAHAMTGRVVREFARAVRDATYAATDAYTRLLPDMAESDMVPRYIPPQVPPYSVAWAKSGGDDAPWLPVYICDHNALDPSKHDLGRVNDRLMSIVKANPEHYRIAYFFGTRHFGVLKPKCLVQWWNCPNHAQYVQSHSNDVAGDDDDDDDLSLAVDDTYAFLASDHLARPFPYDLDSERDRLDQYLAPQSAQPTPNHPPPTPAVKTTHEATPASKAPSADKPSLPKPRRGRPPKDPSPPTDAAVIAAASVPRVDPDVWTTNACVAWAKHKGCPWWPSYLCDPTFLRDDLVLLGSSHRPDLERAKREPTKYKLVYYFGSNNFGLHTVDASKPNMKPWNHADHKLFCSGYPIKMNADAKKILDEFKDALNEAEAFLKRDPRQRLLPYMVPTDMNLALPAPEKYAIPLNQMVWALSDAYPWLPAFVCDPEHLPCDLRALGIDARKMLAKAQAKPDECWLVYYFGSRTFALHKTRGSIKLWECSEYEALIKGHAESMVLADDAWDEFAKAMSNAADFMANDPADRVLPGFEPTNTSRTDEPDAIDLTSSPEATPPSGRRREVASGKRHACRPRQDESAPSDRSGDDTATDQELEGELSVNSKVMRNKRSISQHAETKKAADDFKYNPTQRQVLQAIELKEEVAPDKIEGLLPLGRAKRHSGTSDATHENAADNMQHSSDTSEIVETDPTFMKYDLEDGMQDLLTPVDPEPPVTDGGTPQKSTANDNAASHSTKLAGIMPTMPEGAKLNEQDGAVIGDALPAQDQDRRVMWAFVDGLRWWPVHPLEEDPGPRPNIQVLHFGTYVRSVTSWDALRPWHCDDHGSWVATAATEEGSVAGVFTVAMEEAESFLESGELPAIDSKSVIEGVPTDDDSPML